MPGLDDSDSAMAASFVRRVPLSGAVNFRDLGGYTSADGRRMRTGQVFRSDQLADLSDEDLERVSALGLRHICDLRAESERLHKPNRSLPGTVVHDIGFMPLGGDSLMAGVRALTVAGVETLVADIYRDFVLAQTASYARLFELMLEPEAYPLLVHCTSGRDRTGFAAVLLLSALGVPRTTVAEDYALSDRYRRDLAFQLGSDVDPAVMAAITRAHPAYLAAVFEVIDQRWGSTDRYLREALGLSDEARERLKSRLLEAPTN